MTRQSPLGECALRHASRHLTHSHSYSIFRAFFSKDVFKDKPEIAHLVEGGDRRTVWIGPDSAYSSTRHWTYC